MIFLNIIDLVAINYDSIRFLLSWITPVFIWGSLKFINSVNQNEKYHYRVLNHENFWGSLIKWFGFKFMLTLRSIDCFTSKWIINRFCAVYIMLSLIAEEWIERISQQQENWYQNHKHLIKQWIVCFGNELWSILWFWRFIKHVLIFQKVRAPKSANVVIRHRLQLTFRHPS